MRLDRFVRLAALLLPKLLAAATINVGVSGLSYVPNNITIAVGDTVHWSGLIGHNVAQSANAAANTYDGSGFYSGPAIGGPSTFDWTFTSAGDYYYVCEPHASLGMKGQIHVVVPTPTATPCVTRTPSPTPSVTPTATPSATPSATRTFTASSTPNLSATPTETFSESPTFSSSPTFTDSPTPSPSFTNSPTDTPSFSASPTPSITPTATDSPTASVTRTHTPVLSPTPTITPGVRSFAGVEDAGLLASPITGKVLRLWAAFTGVPDRVELRLYSAAGTLLLVRELPPGPGPQRWTVPLNDVPAGAVWIRLKVSQAGRERQGPLLRSYVIQ
jgi:plastocyanin